MVTACHKQWIRENFGECDFGDKRLTKRMIRTAEAATRNPTASFPKMLIRWSDVKGAYRLFDHPRVTFERVARPHWRCVREVDEGVYLLVSDTTDINFGRKRKMAHTGPVGGYHSGRGFLLHSMLMMKAEDGAVRGLAAQKLFYRQPAPKRENSTQRLKRSRESEKWGQLVDEVGTPQGTARFIHIMDSEADDFEVFCHLKQNRADWVVRGYHKQRKVLDPEGREQALADYLTTLPVIGHYELSVRKRGKRLARTAKLEVCSGSLRIPPPRHKSPYVKSLAPEPILMNVVWVREVNPPNHQDRVEWMLLTSLPAENYDQVWQILEYYERRWVIEDWHKGLKSGCSLYERQLKDCQRMEVVTALFSVLAVRFLQLRNMARAQPNEPAETTVPPLWLEVMSAMRPKLPNTPQFTIGQFIREIAKLGGFLGRKSDGEPGWITIWRGWETFHNYLVGYEVAKSYG